MCGLVSYALWMDMYVFWDDDAMLYAQMYASVCVCVSLGHKC